MKLRNIMKKYGPAVGVASLAMVGGPAFAAEIDTSESLGYIAAGIVAAIALGGAMLGLVALIGVGKKTQRAGT
jgi:uncharacterized membrane protein